MLRNWLGFLSKEKSLEDILGVCSKVHDELYIFIDKTVTTYEDKYNQAVKLHAESEYHRALESAARDKLAIIKQLTVR